METTSNLEDLFQNEGIYLVASGNNNGYYTNSFMASTPGNAFWMEAIVEMMKPPEWYWLGKHFSVLCSTGPLMLDRVARRVPFTINVLPSTIIMSCSVCETYPCHNKFARVKNLQGSSWITYDTMIYNFFLCNWRKVLLFILIMIITIILYKRVYNKLSPNKMKSVRRSPHRSSYY